MQLELHLARLCTSIMAHSRFEYVKAFERPDELPLHTFIVVRLDGRGFTRFADAHGYVKPHDVRGLGLMNAAAAGVMREWGEAILAFGESDEFSFVFPRGCTTFGRREAKFVSGIASLFSSIFVMLWGTYFPTVALLYPPSFDARAVAYPTLDSVVDYLKWRQVDTHINSTYNEAFWALVQRGGLSRQDAQARLARTLTKEKHEIMFAHGINYAKLPVMFRRGTTILRVTSQQMCREVLGMDGGERRDEVTAASACDTSAAAEQRAGASAGEDAVPRADADAVDVVTEGASERDSCRRCRYPMHAGVEIMPPPLMPSTLMLVYPDFNRDASFLLDVLRPWDAVTPDAHARDTAKRKAGKKAATAVGDL